MKCVIVTMAALALTLGEEKPARANLIINGSFESYAVPPSLWNTPGGNYNLTPGDTDIVGWTVTRGNIDYLGSFWPAADGFGSLDLDGTPGAGGVSQSFATTVGATYTVTFDFTGNPDSHNFGFNEPTTKTMRVQAAGQFADYSYDTAAMGNTHDDMMWQLETFTFTADATTTTLEFFSTSQVQYTGAALDNVTVTEASVSAAPEPSSLALLGTACASLAGYFGWRRKQPLLA